MLALQEVDRRVSAVRELWEAPRKVQAPAAFRAALKGADFQSVRGKFKFGNNHFPIQDQHIFEVAKDAKGRVSLKTIATPLKDHQDAYAEDGRVNTEVPLEAHIVAAADAFDQIVSGGPRRPGSPARVAIAELEKWSGSQYSPVVVATVKHLVPSDARGTGEVDEPAG